MIIHREINDTKRDGIKIVAWISRKIDTHETKLDNKVNTPVKLWHSGLVFPLKSSVQERGGD